VQVRRHPSPGLGHETSRERPAPEGVEGASRREECDCHSCGRARTTHRQSVEEEVRPEHCQGDPATEAQHGKSHGLEVGAELTTRKREFGVHEAREIYGRAAGQISRGLVGRGHRVTARASGGPTTIVGNDPSVTTAMIGFGTLVAIDALARWLSNVSPRAGLVINGPVRVLVRDGRVDGREMRRAHLSRDHLLAALRLHGRERIEEVHLASLERSGEISFVLASPTRTSSPSGAIDS
jgi:hypothetical protein